MYKLYLLILFQWSIPVLGQGGIWYRDLKDSTYYNQNGLFLNEDSLNKESLKIPITSRIPGMKTSTTALYDSLVTPKDRNLVARTLYALFFRPPKETGEDNIRRLTENSFAEFEGAVINDIYIEVLPPFGYLINEMNFDSLLFYEKIGNKIHFTTKTKRIQRYLLYEKGDTFDSRLFYDNERILRSLPHIHDVRHYIFPKDINYDTIDVVLLVKDVFEVGVGVQINQLDDYKLDFKNENILGYGHHFKFSNRHRGDLEQTEAYYADYQIPNILGSFINLEFSFENSFYKENYSIDVSRNFYAPSTKYAGGGYIIRANEIRDILLRDTILQNKKLKYNFYNLWVGRAFPLEYGNSSYRNNLVLAIRYYYNDYKERPDTVSQNFLSEFHSSNMLMGSVGLSSQRFKRSNLIYGFGRTEDIPEGYSSNFIVGVEQNEFNKRLYAGIDLQGGKYLQGNSYLTLRLKTGSFFSQGDYSQGVIKTDINYFSRLYKQGMNRYRFFAQSTYIKGINRQSDDIISLAHDDGIYGLKSTQLFGNEKLSMHLETVAFTPYYFFGFRIAAFSYLDAGMINNKNNTLFDNTLYTGIGFGLRLRNPNLVFRTVQLKFTFFPTVPTDAQEFFFDITNEERLSLDNFYINQPMVEQFE